MGLKTQTEKNIMLQVHHINLLGLFNKVPIAHKLLLGIIKGNKRKQETVFI